MFQLSKKLYVQVTTIYLWIYAKFTGNVIIMYLFSTTIVFFQSQQWLKNMTNMEIVLIANI